MMDALTTGSSKQPLGAQLYQLDDVERQLKSEKISTMSAREAAIATDSCCLVRARGRSVSYTDVDAAVKTVSGDNSRSYHTDGDPGSFSGGRLFVASLGGYALASKALSIIRDQALAKEDPSKISTTIHGRNTGITTGTTTSSGNISFRGSATQVTREAFPSKSSCPSWTRTSTQPHSEAEEHLILNSVRFHFVKSAYVAGFKSPSSSNPIKVARGVASVLLSNDGKRVLQRIVSSLSYSHGQGVRQDSVMIQGEDEGEDSESADAARNNEASKTMPVWFARVLLFAHISSRTGPFRNGEEVAIVRYYDVAHTSTRNDTSSATGSGSCDGLNTEGLAVDEILGCIMLSWAEEDHQEPWLDVIPASSIRGWVHVVPGDMPTGISIESTEDGNAGDNEPDDDICDNPRSAVLFADSADWDTRTFYVNRFKAITKDTMYDVSEDSISLI